MFELVSAASEFACGLTLSLLAVVYREPFPVIAAAAFIGSIWAYTAAVHMATSRRFLSRFRRQVHDESGCGEFV